MDLNVPIWKQGINLPAFKLQHYSYFQFFKVGKPEKNDKCLDNLIRKKAKANA